MTQIITNNWWGGSWVWVYKYKWSVNTYEDLPSSWMKIWDVYNVVNEHTTAPVFPAWTNVAWTWTEWDALWWSIDLSAYQKKLVEWDWIDIDWDTNEISVESTVINWAAAWATAVQPWDDISDLNNDAGYITSSDIPTNVSAFNNDAWYITSSDIPTNVSAFNNDAGYLVSSDLKQSDWNEADSSKIDYIKNKPTIWNATLTIQKNGTNVNTFTANSTSNVTANISVPTKTSDINNDSGFITKSVNNLDNYTLTTSLSTVATTWSYTDLSSKPDLSVYQTTANLVTDLTNPDDTHYPSAKAVSDALSWGWAWDMLKSVYDPNNVAANAFDYDNFINTPTIPSVIDDLTSLSTTDALSANQWKVLKDAIDNLSWLWKFLSLWNSSTGQPISFPLATPYAYTTWDWFMVEVVDTTDPITNYKPTWSSYTWTASTTVESWTVKQWDVYIYDGTDWLLQVNNEPQVSFSEIAWQPTDNSNLATALNGKQDTLTAGENIKISSNVISANNVFIITEDDVTVSTTDEYWVAPYNTSYYYTNIDISANAGIEWREWAIYTFVVNTEMVVASAYRNVRVKIWTWTYIPVMWTTAALAGHSYFAKTAIRQFQYTTKYESWWALHVFTDSNTTYKAMTEAQATAWTATTALTISPAILKWAVQTHSPVKSVNWQTWTVSLTIPTSSDDLTEWSTNLFLTSAERTKLSNTSGTNTWDETASTIKTKLWITTLSGANTWDETTATIKTKLWAASASADWYLTKSDFATFNWKQSAISDLSTIRSNATAWAGAATTIAWYGDVVTHDASEFYSSSNPNWYTSNTWTITGITMNWASKWTSWVVDLWTVITAHQDISWKANTADVLTKTNTTAYTPTADYHPATKKYVDDIVWNIETLLAAI